MPPDWQQRAELTERAVLSRSVRRIVGLPHTRLGIIAWPPGLGDRLSVRWNFWWQAHLLDCAIDAWVRSPDQARAALVATIARSIKLRNLGRFTNDFYDDMAWIGLALHRAAALGLIPAQPGVRDVVTDILDAWSPPIGGIPWRRSDEFFNAPANGPAAILLARTGFPHRARQLADWIDDRLRIPGSDLIADGFHPGEQVQPVYYTYSQGVVLGAELELSRGGGDRLRVHRLVAAVDAELSADGVLRGGGGGDGGLFAGILARYLALVASGLGAGPAGSSFGGSGPAGSGPAGSADGAAAATARRLVLDSAESAWAHRVQSPHGPLFGPDWTRSAVLPVRGGPAEPERDLSVQLSGWMLMEAAASLTRTAGGVVE